MRILRAMIVDDEPPARDAIATILRDAADIEVIGQYADGNAALEAIRRAKPDLVFLDVQMPGLNGFEVVNAIEPEECPAIIFITAYDWHAIQAFELAAVDYLLKPFSDARFHTALTRAKTRVRDVDLDGAQSRLRSLLEQVLKITPPREGDPAGRPVRLGFKVGTDYCFVEANDVVSVEAQGDFVNVRADGQVYRVRETLREIEKRLDPGHFSQVHRSFLVNTDRIRKVSTGAGGELTLLMNDGTKVPVSRGGRARLMAFMDR